MYFPQKYACILKKEKTPWSTVQGHAATPAYGNESKMFSFTHLEDISIAPHYHWPSANTEHWPELGLSNPLPQKTAAAKAKEYLRYLM